MRMRANSNQNRLLRKHLLGMLVLLAGAAAVCAPAAWAGPVVGRVDVIDCITYPEGDAICTPRPGRTSLTIPVTYGNVVSLDAVEASQAKDESGEQIPLEEGIKIELTKTPPTLNYPLRYLHTVPYAPYEEVRKVRNTQPGIQACIDAATSDAPTCGWQYKADGTTKVPDSQGFCSNRDLLNLKTCSASDTWRGEEVLGEKSTLDNSFSIGHCMRMGDIWYHGYEIGKYTNSSDVNIKLTKGNNVRTLTLSPSYKIVTTPETESAVWTVRAQLLGSLDPEPSGPDLSNYILYIPGFGPDSVVNNYNLYMLLVAREMVTRDGSECNKIGVGYSAFRKEAGCASKTKAGECLANQLFHLHNEDLQRLAVNANAETKYLIRGMNMFKGSMAFKSGMDKALRYSITDVNYSLVNLSFGSSPLTQVTVSETEEDGIFDYIKVVPAFASMSEGVTMELTVRNNGGLRSNYIVSVKDCSVNIRNDIPSKAVTVEPQSASNPITFNINTLQNIQSMHYCWVYLTSPTGKVYYNDMGTATHQVFFDTIKHPTTYPWDLKLENKESVKYVPQPPSP